MLVLGSDINIYGTLTNTVSMRYSFDNGSMITATVSPTIPTVQQERVLINRGFYRHQSGVNLLSLQGSAAKISHILELFPTSGLLSIDYITVKPSKYTNITGHNLIIDDTDERSNTPALGTKPRAISHYSDHRGSISVYGLLHPQAGKLSASFSVDGGASTNFTPYDGSQTANASSWLLFQQFFHQDLAPGNHSLLVTLEQATGSQMLWIDSIIYQGALVAEAHHLVDKAKTQEVGGAEVDIESYRCLPMYPPHSSPTLTRQVDADPPPFTPTRSRASQEYRPRPAQDSDPVPTTPRIRLRTMRV
ncbi:hypothetical protein BDZ97DRAFT_1759763 [Flammula alnicola]|nr:hypothetical protein BDZ97DRAFT_1759763 [Flammula alnicola]